MKTEIRNSPNWKKIIESASGIAGRALMLTATISIGLNFINNIGNAGIIFRAIGDQLKPGYSSEYGAALPDPADVIIVLGAGNIYDDDGNVIEGSHQKIRQDAAAIAAAEFNEADVILLANGVYPTPALDEDTGEYMVKQLEKFGDQEAIPGNIKVFTENRSTSTATNLTEALKFMKQYGFKTGIVITDKFHTNRTQAYININGYPFEVVSAESLLIADDSRQIRLMFLRNKDSGRDEQSFREILKLLAMLVDPQGAATSRLETVLFSWQGLDVQAADQKLLSVNTKP